MLVVNNIGVFVDFSAGVLQVRVIQWQVIMTMPERGLLVSRPPDDQAGQHCHGSKQAQDHERSTETDLRAQPAGERIGDQPAGMGQRKLRRGAAEQAMEDVR